MKLKLFSLTAAVIAVAAAQVATAAPFQETFGSLTATAPPAGTSTISGFSYTSQFGPPNTTLTDNEATDYPFKNTDSKYLQWNGFTDQYLTVGGTGLVDTGSTSTRLGVAFAIRVDTLAATSGTNTIDVLFVAGGASQFGLTVANDQFRMASSNGFSSVQLSNTAFNASSGSNWADGNWRVLAGIVSPAGAGAGRATWWSVSPNTGVATLLVDQTGLTNGNPPADIGLVGLGASLDVPANVTTAISLDQLSIYNSTQTASNAAFLAAVSADYKDNASVTDWSVY